MTFDQWLNRPVYKAQCVTWKAALTMHGIELAPGHGLALRGDDDHPLMTFHAFKPYRTPAANALRKRVADHVRQSRSQS